jgi:hypothetical protein
MDKILVTVRVPAIERQYDAFIPINLPMNEVIQALQKSLCELSDGFYEIKENVLLFDSIDGKQINQNNIVKFSGLKNGSNILLM